MSWPEKFIRILNKLTTMQKLDIYKYQNQRFNNLITLFFEKECNNDNNIMIFCDNKKKLDAIDKILWEYNPPSWIPHLITDDEYANQSKIILSKDITKNINSSESVCIIDSKINRIDEVTQFKHIAYFIPSDENNYSESIEILKMSIQNNNTYIQQTNGKWVKEE